MSGSAGELVALMKARLGEESRDLPKSPRGVTARLRRYAPALRAAGIEVNMNEKDAYTRRRVIVISAAGGAGGEA